MATTKEYIEYVCAQIAGTGEIRYRKMFGEFMVYVDDKPVVIVCDNTPYVKKLDGISGMMQHAETGFPYDGAKEHYVLDIDDAEFSRTVVAELERLIPVPKPRKKKQR